ncbi:MAG: hypothetical protein H0U52_16265 [Chloroflexi bacterium]|nr:hypothetical protein [Chloroflexota bacterium]
MSDAEGVGGGVIAVFEAFLFAIAIALVVAVIADVRHDRRERRDRMPRMRVLAGQSVTGPHRANRWRP